MRLYYLDKDGERKDIELTEKPVTIGRSPDADVLILDEKASRVHCGIRFWDDEFFIKDLKSKNGTFVNDAQIDIHQLKAGDRIRLGSTVFIFEKEPSAGTDTALLAMQDQFKEGKGYSTILREIVDEASGPVAVVTPGPAIAPVADPPHVTKAVQEEQGDAAEEAGTITSEEPPRAGPPPKPAEAKDKTPAREKEDVLEEEIPGLPGVRRRKIVVTKGRARRTGISPQKAPLKVTIRKSKSDDDAGADDA